MSERTYPQHAGTNLDPKVFTHPVTGTPQPILVLDVGGAAALDISALSTSAKQDLILAALSSMASEATLNSVKTNTAPPTVKTPGYSRTTTSGTVAAGFRAVTISNVGTADGTVLGTLLKPNETVGWEWEGTLGAVAYDATGTTFAIVTVGGA